METSARHITYGDKTAADHQPGLSCRFCGHPLTETFVDLGMSPLCQTHISPEQLHEMEPFYPLRTCVQRSTCSGHLGKADSSPARRQLIRAL